MNNQIMEKINQMFPNSNLTQKVQEAQSLVNQAQSEGSTPKQLLEKIGITESGINDIFNKYGNTMQAKAVLGMLGTNPEQLKSQAVSILKGPSNGPVRQDLNKSNPNKFPSLK